MPKPVKKTAAKPAKSTVKKAAAPTAKKKATAKPAAKPATKPAVSPARVSAANPGRVITRRTAGKKQIVGLVGSVTNEEISLRAYYIAERRRNLGLPGDAQSDWLEAERQLRG